METEEITKLVDGIYKRGRERVGEEVEKERGKVVEKGEVMIGEVEEKMEKKKKKKKKMKMMKKGKRKKRQKKKQKKKRRTENVEEE
ncbi:hypothetical protein LSTR_LSTR005386 [Laodelphax striatellus]|uniref:Uncharacterized protein n=1 Tax=Laodelphax striatellus TaxID=195883 RepID=A0A482WR33_LAOST|nr:hypothetical protein LSTR_LSTR005386 [Laodelphax striatellus]